jgi:hypothetical protein
VEGEERLAVNIPPGISEGTALRIRGHGQPGTERTAPAGDLYVVVHSAPDPRFERRGADLYHTAHIGFSAATLGTRLTIPTLEGPVKLTIPPATQPDTLLRLPGKGLPEFGGSRRGDLYVMVRVHLPEKLTSEQRQLYERLAALEEGSPTRPQNEGASATIAPPSKIVAPMKSFKLAAIYGFVLWAIPLTVAFVLFPLHNNQRPLFESLMAVTLASCSVVLASLYLRKVEANFLREGILLGILWPVMSIALDLLIFTWGPMKMSLSDYLMDIGVTYLIFPAITIGMGYLLEARRR